MARIRNSRAKVKSWLPTLLRVVCLIFWSRGAKSGIVICLHLLVFFGESRRRRRASHLLFSSSPLPFCSVVDCVISRRRRNLYQQRTITVNLANVYKVRRLAAGLCTPRLVFSRLCFLFFATRVLCACARARVCVLESVRLRSAVFAAGRISGGVTGEGCCVRRGRL